MPVLLQPGEYIKEICFAGTGDLEALLIAHNDFTAFTPDVFPDLLQVDQYRNYGYGKNGIRQAVLPHHPGFLKEGSHVVTHAHLRITAVSSAKQDIIYIGEGQTLRCRQRYNTGQPACCAPLSHLQLGFGYCPLLFFQSFQMAAVRSSFETGFRR